MVTETRNDWVELYAKRFTPAEITSLLEFYDSPLGRKIVAFQPALQHRDRQRAFHVLGFALDEVPKWVSSIDFVGVFEVVTAGKAPAAGGMTRPK